MSLHFFVCTLVVGFTPLHLLSVRISKSEPTKCVDAQNTGVHESTVVPETSGSFTKKQIRDMVNHPEFKLEVWGPTCWGHWSPWTKCTAQCYKEKTFSLEVADCEDYFGVFPDQHKVYKLCLGDECPMKAGPHDLNPFMKEMRSALVHHGLHSGLLDSFGNIISDMQLYLQLMIIIVVIVLALVQHLQIKWMPDMAVAIPVAAFFAMMARFFGFGGVNFDKSANAIFGVVVSQLMNDVLIPISLFEGAYHLQQRNFWSQFGYGLLFAVVGTGISTVYIAIMVKFTGQWGWHPVADWRQSFAYAAFMADVDPVATLSIFSNLKVDALLSTLVAGEATLNDPIALVIFGICNEKTKNIHFDPIKQIQGGLILLVGSITLGLLVGLCLSYFLKALKVKGKGPLEAMYIGLSAYFGFGLGEFLGFSGIIVTLFSGLMMGIYATQIVTDGSTCDSFLIVFARWTDAVMFVIIGFATFLVDTWDGVKLGLLTIVFCFISRALMVCMLVPVVNFCKMLGGQKVLNLGQCFMIFHSGLRGGMTVMMALMMDPYWAKDQNVMLDATIVSVIGLTYLCGCTGPIFLKLTGVPMDVPQEDGTLVDIRSRSSKARSRVHEFLISAMGIRQTLGIDSLDLGFSRQITQSRYASSAGSFHNVASFRPTPSYRPSASFRPP